MRGLLVRVGIDQTAGGWNAPADPETGRFIFVPIPDKKYNGSGEYVPDGRRTYREVLDELSGFAADCCQRENKCFQLPKDLLDQPMHLDPDFFELTYGDDERRGRKLKGSKNDPGLQKGDFLAFYSGLRSVRDQSLIYALIGILELDGAAVAPNTLQGRGRLCNAHSRWDTCHEADVVAIGRNSGNSGVFERCIPIGSFRRNAYRVYPSLLDEWAI